MNAAAHRALWITFLCRRFRDTPENVITNILRKTNMRWETEGSTLQVLKHQEKEIPKALLGVALWNLLPGYRESALRGQADGYDEYKQFFAEVYHLTVDQIQQTSPDAETPVFPEDPWQSMQEPLLTQEDSLNASTLRLQVLLAGHLSDLDPDPVKPWHWTKRGNPFWKEVGPKPANWEGKIAARLQLPDETTDKPLPIEMNVGISRDGFEGRTDFEIAENERTKVCYGYVSVRKEAGRPGLTRVTVQRTVRFAPDLDQFRVPTALYWLYADLICGAQEHLIELKEQRLPPSGGPTPRSVYSRPKNQR